MPLKRAVRVLHLLAIRPLSALAFAVPTLVAAQTVVPVAPFTSVMLYGGGEVILRHGPNQRVTLLKGSGAYTGFTIAEGGLLVIEKCKSHCPREYDLEVEIVTPDIAEISATDGGTIESRGSFPSQTQIGTGVTDGGTIDIRSMSVENVTASVESGGRILTKPQTALSARVADGGIITYWGEAQVKSSIQGGGAVAKGTAADAGKSLAELNPPCPTPPTPPTPPLPPSNMQHSGPIPPIPPIPPVPPVPPGCHRGG